MKSYTRYLILFNFILVSALGLQCGKSDRPDIVPIDPPATNTFTNPITQGADPWVYEKDDVYYYMQTTGNSIRLWKTDAMSELASAASRQVFVPVPGGANSQHLWAPEIHFLDNKWYIYYTAGNGNDITGQRTWVLENSSADPTTGTWVEKGRIYHEMADFFAIDGTVMEYNGSRYFLWSGRPDPTGVVLTQNIYIAKMSNPWTLTGPVTKLTEPEFSWERMGFGVNEGPQVLRSPGDDIFMVYSASYCGTDDYSLGMLRLAKGGDPMNLADWTKNPQPIFSKNPQNNAYAPGHNAFFKSPDGTEDWVIYHANTNAGQGCGGNRNIRIQKFTFSSTQVPVFGEPVATGRKIEKPSGEDE